MCNTVGNQPAFAERPPLPNDELIVTQAYIPESTAPYDRQRFPFLPATDLQEGSASQLCRESGNSFVRWGGRGGSES